VGCGFGGLGEERAEGRPQGCLSARRLYPPIPPPHPTSLPRHRRTGGAHPPRCVCWRAAQSRCRRSALPAGPGTLTAQRSSSPGGGGMMFDACIASGVGVIGGAAAALAVELECRMGGKRCSAKKTARPNKSQPTRPKTNPLKPLRTSSLCWQGFLCVGQLCSPSISFSSLYSSQSTQYHPA